MLKQHFSSTSLVTASGDFATQSQSHKMMMVTQLLIKFCLLLSYIEHCSASSEARHLGGQLERKSSIFYNNMLEKQFEVTERIENEKESKIESPEYTYVYCDCSLPWTYCDNGTCKCGAIYEDVLQCYTRISHSYCITFNEATGRTELGLCTYKLVNNIKQEGVNSLLYAEL